MGRGYFLSAVATMVLLVAFVIQPQVRKQITADVLRSWISYLASDDMRGRANGSPEMKVAAEWIKDKFVEAGLMPMFADKQYIQKYSFSGRRSTVINEQNVVGFIEGSDPELKDQYIILSAHFDHVGVRKSNSPDSIFNGADDNAAGTCTLIGIAKAIHDSHLKPGRSIIFAAFSGEESGMRGSRYFVANTPFDLKKGYVNMNFEMTGHSERYGKNNYYMTGCKLSQLDDAVKAFSKDSKFTLIDTIAMADRLFYASDNIAFSRVSFTSEATSGIPSGTFATTTVSDYLHTPGDEASLFDFENMADLVNHFTDIVIRLSDSKSEINWTDPKFRRL